MTALVTGGTGFVGSAVVRALLAEGARVRALVRPGSDRQNLTGLDVELAEGDLLYADSLRRAVSGCRSLFHVAADYRLWIPDPERLYAVNVAGTRTLLRVAAEAGVERIVYTSSVAALGLEPHGEPADETTPVRESNLIGHYKRSKYRAERAVDQLIEEGVPAVIVNPSSPIGPRDIRPTPTGRMVLEAAAGRMPAYVDTGLNVVHVDDVAAGHLLARDRGVIGERYILGGENKMLGEILGCVCHLAGRKAPRFRLPHAVVIACAAVAEAGYRVVPPRREPMLTLDSARMAKKRMFFSSARAERVLGYRARPAAEALRDSVEWFAENGYLSPGVSRRGL